MTEIEALQHSFSGVPVNRFLGMRLVSRSAAAAEVALELRPEFLQEEGVVHGGILSTLADTSAVYVLHPTLEEGQSMTSIEFKVNFLKPGLDGSGMLTARAKRIQRGRTIGLCDVEVHQADRLLLKGSFTYLFFSRETRASSA